MEWSKIVERFGKLLPRAPSLDSLPCARIPPPPLLREKTDLGALVRAHNAACFEWFERRGARLEDLDADAEKILASAAEVLLAERISPFAWCGFSCQVWATTVAAKRPKKFRRAPPPLKWAYHEGRLRKHVECSAFCEDRFPGDRLLVEPEHVELAARYERMRYELLATNELDEEKVKRVVDRHLSRTARSKLEGQIEDRVEKRQREIARGIENGVWVWG